MTNTDMAVAQAMQKALSNWKSTENWWQSVGSQAEPYDLSRNNSRNGVFFQKEFVARNFEDKPFGGFFPVVTSENRDAVIDALFANGEGDWLKSYLDKGERPSGFFNNEPQKEAFIKAYDKLMAGFLDVHDRGESDFNMNRFVGGLTADQTVTDLEFHHVLNTYGFKPLIDEMGEDLSQKWIAFAGGTLQGLIDYNALKKGTTYWRFSEAEFNGLISAQAKAAIEASVREIGRSQEGNSDVVAAISIMEDLCSSNNNYSFIPPVSCKNGQCL